MPTEIRMEKDQSQPQTFIDPLCVEDIVCLTCRTETKAVFRLSLWVQVRKQVEAGRFYCRECGEPVCFTPKEDN